MIERFAFLFVAVTSLSGIVLEAKESADPFVGKPWAELGQPKFPGYDLPLKWPGRKLALRYFQPSIGKFIVTIVENRDPRFPSKDPIVAALDIRNFIKIVPNSKIFDAPTSSCREKASSRTTKLVIGIITQNVEKPEKTYKPIRAWVVTPEKLKFEEVDRDKVICELAQNKK